MRAVSIMYHDVVEGDDWDASGFPGADAAQYKMTLQNFDEHLAAIKSSGAEAVTISSEGAKAPFYITFDDGGVSAVGPICKSLEAHGWRGHFFITTDRIGTKGFVSEGDIRELHARGHVIGSHSCSHPTRMAACSSKQLQREWSESSGKLSDIVGAKVCVASVPGGYYSKEVAAAAAQAGITTLFNSEPTSRSHMVGPCLVLGRYTIKRDTSAADAAGLAVNDALLTVKQATLWKAKKIAKLGGPLYLKLRARFVG